MYRVIFCVCIGLFFSLPLYGASFFKHVDSDTLSQPPQTAEPPTIPITVLEEGFVPSQTEHILHTPNPWVILHGTAHPNSLVLVRVDALQGVYYVPVQEDGNWQLPFDQELPQGHYYIDVSYLNAPDIKTYFYFRITGPQQPASRVEYPAPQLPHTWSSHILNADKASLKTPSQLVVQTTVYEAPISLKYQIFSEKNELLWQKNPSFKETTIQNEYIAISEDLPNGQYFFVTSGADHEIFSVKSIDRFVIDNENSVQEQQKSGFFSNTLLLLFLMGFLIIGTLLWGVNR